MCAQHSIKIRLYCFFVYSTRIKRQKGIARITANWRKNKAVSVCHLLLKPTGGCAQIHPGPGLWTLWCKIASCLTWRKKFLASCSSRTPFSVIKSNRSLHGSGLSITMMKLSCRSKKSMSLTTPSTAATRCIRHTSSGTRSHPIWNECKVETLMKCEISNARCFVSDIVWILFSI